MVLVYMLTKMGYMDGIHVTIYSSTMDPSWVLNINQLSKQTGAPSCRSHLPEDLLFSPGNWLSPTSEGSIKPS